MLIIGWLFASLFIGLVFGAARKIGFFLSFLASLFLSPLIGLIITLASETKEKAAAREKMLALQQESIIQQRQSTGLSVADELTKLNKIFTDGIISKEEYELQKKKLLH